MRRRFFSSDSKVAFNIDNYLTMVALEDGLTVLFENEIEYGIDGVGWTKLDVGTFTPPINAGQTLSFRGELSPNPSNGIGTFTINKKCNLLGNCMSMLFGDNAAGNFSLSGKRYIFYKLFYGCTSIINVSSDFLPATTLGNYCYYDMFYGCTSLTSAPELPATTLGNFCYTAMFSGCTSLTTAPELPATTLDYGCYSAMFYGCTSLTTAPDLPATTLATACYRYMFEGCTSLTTAPELPATTLDYGCYYEMFSGCSNLNYIKMLATDISASNCLDKWVNGVSSSGTFVKNSTMTSLPTGVSGIPSGWTVENAKITFTIADTEYQAEEGMTWEEWINSDYNTDGCGIYTKDTSDCITTSDTNYVVCRGSVYVEPDEEIIHNYNYVTYYDFAPI